MIKNLVDYKSIFHEEIHQDLNNSWASEIFAISGIASVVFGGYLTLLSTGMLKKSLGVGLLAIGTGQLAISFAADSLRQASVRESLLDWILQLKGAEEVI